MHKTAGDKATGKQSLFLMIFFYFSGASFSIVLSMVNQPKYQKWTINFYYNDPLVQEEFAQTKLNTCASICWWLLFTGELLLI